MEKGSNENLRGSQVLRSEGSQNHGSSDPATLRPLPERPFGRAGCGPIRKVLFAGGGTLGPVTPLLAVAETWKAADPSVAFVWVGTPHGPEQKLIESVQIPFISLPVLRLTRYPSREWLTLPIDAVRTFVYAWQILRRERPDLIATAGGYTGVPLAVLGWLHSIPVWAHQSDVRVILSTRLVVPFARLITTAWKQTAASLPAAKTVWIGSPVRERPLSNPTLLKAEGIELDPARQTVLMFGGGGGSRWLNETAQDILEPLSERVNIILLSGPKQNRLRVMSVPGKFTCVEKLVDAMPEAIRVADVVVCRAGMGTIADLAHFSKAAILIPLPNSPQLDNAQELSQEQAAIVLDERTTHPEDLQKQILDLLLEEKRRAQLGARLAQVMPTNINTQLVQLIQERC